MEDPLDSYRQAIADIFSTVTIGNTQLSSQEGVYDHLSRNLAFRFDDVTEQEWIRLYVVVTYDFRIVNSIEYFVKKLENIIAKAKDNQLRQDCIYVVPIATSTDGDLVTFHNFKSKLDSDVDIKEIFFLK